MTVKAEEIDAALAHLERSGLAFRKMVQAEGGGRPAECWYPRQEPDGDGDKLMNDNISSSHHDDDAETCADTGREGNNSADSPEQKRGEETPGREITNSGQDAQAELIPSPASAGSKLPGMELIPSPPDTGSKLQKELINSLPPQQKPNPAESLEDFMGVIRQRGLRFRWAWREDLGSGKSDDVSCVVIVEGCPEYDALCMRYQDHLQAVIPLAKRNA